MNISDVQNTLQKLTQGKVTQSEIARALKKDRCNISKKAKRGTELKVSELNELEKYFNVNLTDAKMIRLIESMPDIQQNDNNQIVIKYFPNVYLSAGYGVEVFDEDFTYVVIDELFLTSEKGMKIKPENCKMVKISGNSMFPEYQHGDRVIIDESDTNLTDGQIYAFRYDGQCYVKEINRAGNKIKCISINKDYDPFYIELETDFKVFGRIIPRVRL